jgi:hypothetical protein
MKIRLFLELLVPKDYPANYSSENFVVCTREVSVDLTLEVEMQIEVKQIDLTIDLVRFVGVVLKYDRTRTTVHARGFMDSVEPNYLASLIRGGWYIDEAVAENHGISVPIS